MYRDKSVKQRSITGLATALGLSLLLLASAQSQEVNSPDTAESVTALTEAQIAAAPIEEIIVTGQRTFNSLIREGAELTQDFYMRLNEVLDNDDFKINCWNEFPTGSRISTRVCRMRYQERLMNRQSVSLIRSLSTTEDGTTVSTGSIDDVQIELRQKMLEFEDELLEAVNTDTVLNEQVIRLIALKSAVENYESPREQRRREERDSRD